jgi:hypothetical protein
MQLGEHWYDIAARAHADGMLVEAVGTLTHVSKTFYLDEITTFREMS